MIPLLVQPISNEESTNILPVPWIRFHRCRFHGIDRLGTIEVQDGAISLDCDVDQFPLFEVVVKKRRRTWRWPVCTSEGAVVMQGSESSRPAAKYKGDRALFLLLLSAPYRSAIPRAPVPATSTRAGTPPQLPHRPTLLAGLRSGLVGKTLSNP